jgi:hypothetical protein
MLPESDGRRLQSTAAIEASGGKVTTNGRERDNLGMEEPINWRQRAFTEID